MFFSAFVSCGYGAGHGTPFRGDGGKETPSPPSEELQHYEHSTSTQTP